MHDGLDTRGALTVSDFRRRSAAYPSSRFELTDGIPWIVSQRHRLHRIVVEYQRHRALTGAASPRILDVGAYPGTLLKLLRILYGERGAMVGIGLEGSDEFAQDLAQYEITFARVNLDPTIHVDDPAVERLPTRIPYADGSFDFVFCTETLEHLLDPLVTLREIARVLSPRGCFLMTTPNLARAANRLKLMAGISVNFPLDQSIMYNKGNWRPHMREYSLTELRRMFRDAGFSPLRDAYLDLSDDDVRLFGPDARRVRLQKAALKPFQLLPSWRHTILSVMRK
jgi:SAM-dependent methyltransferase